MTVDDAIEHLEKIRNEHGGEISAFHYAVDWEYGHFYEVQLESSNIKLETDGQKRVLIG